MTDNKRKWPELEGKTADEAEAVVKAERPDLTVERISADGMATMDYIDTRVRIKVNAEGVVASPPMIG